MSNYFTLDNLSQIYVKSFISKNNSKFDENISTLISDIKKTTISKNVLTSKSLTNKKRLKIEDNSVIHKTFNNTFYPRSYKNKNYLKEIKVHLPPIKTQEGSISNNELMTDYESSINKFNYMYKNKGDELDISKESFDEEINKIIKNKIFLYP